MKRFSIAAVMGAVLIAASALRAEDLGGQPGSYTLSSDDVGLLMMPELKTAKPPQWLKPGMVLTWYGALATIPNSRIGGMVEDPDGNWCDASGKKYRQDASTSISGHGYSQISVIAVHDDVVVGNLTVFKINDPQSPLQLTQSDPFSTPGGCFTGFWMNPDVLAKHKDIAGEGFRSTRMAYECAGRRYDALWTNTASAGGSTTCVTDLASGLVLHTGISSCTEPSTMNINGVLTPVGGATNLSQTTFQGMRQSQIPWAGARLPPVIANLRKLTYHGTLTSFASAGIVYTAEYKTDTVITGRGKDFLQARRTAVTEFHNGMAPAVVTSDVVTSINELTPLAIPTEHLARLRQGQVLDEDPVTKFVTTVLFVGRDEGGHDVVILSSKAGKGSSQTDCTYDLHSGMLIAVISADPISHVLSKMFLAGKE